MILECVITLGESHMSRTYRRKNSYEEFDWTFEREYCGTWGPRGCAFYRRYFEGQELKRELARYHADDPGIAWSIPSYFRKDKNRSLRSKNKAILNRAVHNINDEPMFIPFIRDAMYDWW